MHEIDRFAKEGAAAAVHRAASTTLGRVSTAAAAVVPEAIALSSALELATVVTSRVRAHAKPFVQRVLESPTVERVVGNVREAAVGAGSLVETQTNMASRLRGARVQLDALRGRGPEAEATAQVEAEAWEQVLAGDGWVDGGINSNSSSRSSTVKVARGQELVVQARASVTSTFLVPAGALLQWRFRVASHDVGFSLRLRVQGDGGATEVDVFSLQRYTCGLTIQGEWSPSIDSQLVLVFDNSYSYLREKIVAFQTALCRSLPPNLD